MMMMSKDVGHCQSFPFLSAAQSDSSFGTWASRHRFRLARRLVAFQPPVQHALPDIAFDPGHHEQRGEDAAANRRDELPQEIAARAFSVPCKNARPNGLRMTSPATAVVIQGQRVSSSSPSPSQRRRTSPHCTSTASSAGTISSSVMEVFSTPTV